MSRRDVVRGLPLLGFATVLAACGRTGEAVASGHGGGHRALVYRGPASCRGCAEAVGSILAGPPFSLRVAYCGPDETTALSAEALAGATLYVQPGGGNDLRLAWSQMRPYAALLRRWVRRGGHYLGICLGGYLAGYDPGFGLLPGDSGEYVTSPGATVRGTGDTTVTVDWGGRPRRVYFQDGPYFTLRPSARAAVLATYPNGLAAAVVARCGAGSVGVAGPHPEADASWFAEAGLQAPKESTLDLARDLIARTLSASTSEASAARSR